MYRSQNLVAATLLDAPHVIHEIYITVVVVYVLFIYLFIKL